MDKKALGKSIFHLVLSLLPGKVGRAASQLEKAITTPGAGATRRERVLDKVTHVTGEGLELADVLSDEIITDPRFKSAVGKINDGLIEAANIAQQIHDEAEVKPAA